MEISAEKTKLMTNSVNSIRREIKVKGQKLGTVTSFKYLGVVVSDVSSKPEVLSRIAQATADLTKLKPIWRDNNISLESKVLLMRSLVISIFLYACESCPLTAELEKRTQAFEMRCYWRLLKISYKDHVLNEEVCRKIQADIGEFDDDKGVCGCLTEARVSLCLAPPAFPVNRADAESLIPRLLRPSIFCYFEDYGPWRPPCVYDT